MINSHRPSNEFAGPGDFYALGEALLHATNATNDYEHMRILEWN